MELSHVTSFYHFYFYFLTLNWSVAPVESFLLLLLMVFRGVVCHYHRSCILRSESVCSIEAHSLDDPRELVHNSVSKVAKRQNERRMHTQQQQKNNTFIEELTKQEQAQANLTR